MRSALLLVMLALCTQYVADFTFLYQSNHTTYVPGKYDDLFYLIAYFIMTTALIRFHTIYKNLRAPVKTAAVPKANQPPMEAT
jgi:hypothetical protein